MDAQSQTYLDNRDDVQHPVEIFSTVPGPERQTGGFSVKSEPPADTEHVSFKQEIFVNEFEEIKQEIFVNVFEEIKQEETKQEEIKQEIFVNEFEKIKQEEFKQETKQKVIFSKDEHEFEQTSEKVKTILNDETIVKKEIPFDFTTSPGMKQETDIRTDLLSSGSSLRECDMDEDQCFVEINSRPIHLINETVMKPSTTQPITTHVNIEANCETSSVCGNEIQGNFC